MDTILLVAQIVIVLALVVVILLQRNASDGLAGLGSSGGSGMLSSRGKANLLTRTTSLLATLFILNSLALAWIASHNVNQSVVEQYSPEQSNTETIEPENTPEPEVPLGD